MSAPFTLLKNKGTVPNIGLIKCGFQLDRPDKLAIGVANSKWGKIPGKIHADGTFWYPFRGQEHSTSDFWYVIASPEKIRMVCNDGSGPPRGALAVGEETSNGKKFPVYAAVAVTQHGAIPSKAFDNICYYGFCLKESHTDKFYWLVYQD